MLLIGSAAAKAINALPSWRRGQTDDTDLRGTKQELSTLLDRLRAIYGASEVAVKESDKYPGKFMVRSSMGRVEYDATCLPSFDVLNSLPDTCSVSLLGLTIKVPSVETLYLMKRSHINFAIHWPKNFKDMISFAEKIDLGLRSRWKSTFTPKHLEAYEALRKEAFERYSHTQNRIKLAKSEAEFFRQSAKFRSYVHDDIHKAIAFRDRPMYEYCKKDADKPLLSKELFLKLSTVDQLRLFLEESAVVGIERFYLPERKTKSPLILRAGSAKLLHTMCKGWFQDFGLDHAHFLRKPTFGLTCDWNFIELFETALLEGRIGEQDGN